MKCGAYYAEDPLQGRISGTHLLAFSTVQKDNDCLLNDADYPFDINRLTR